LGVVTTSPTQDCFKRFRVAFELYAGELLKVAGLPEDTNIPLFIDPKAFLEDRCLRPMNEDQLAAMYSAVTDRYVDKRITSTMFRTIYASYHALGLESDATGDYPARDLTVRELALAMLHTYDVHRDYYVKDVPN
jgi:hypothetical protein